MTCGRGNGSSGLARTWSRSPLRYVRPRFTWPPDLPSKEPHMRVLIAGVGNVLRGDDGFGIEVLRRLELQLRGADGVRFYESGIAGIGLVQQLFDGYDAVIVLDAVNRGAE